MFTTMGDVWGFLPQADDLAVEDFAKRAYGYAGVAARKMQRRADGAIVVRQMMNLSSSFDHRVVDGMHAAEFIQTIRGYLECPATLFTE